LGTLPKPLGTWPSRSSAGRCISETIDMIKFQNKKIERWLCHRALFEEMCWEWWPHETSKFFHLGTKEKKGKGWDGMPILG
jgi:hypothetical protein